jgi:hypothetical protein
LFILVLTAYQNSASFLHQFYISYTKVIVAVAQLRFQAYFRAFSLVSNPK